MQLFQHPDNKIQLHFQSLFWLSFTPILVNASEIFQNEIISFNLNEYINMLHCTTFFDLYSTMERRSADDVKMFNLNYIADH